MTIKENIQKIRQELSSEIALVIALKYANREQIDGIIKSGVKDFGFNTYQQLREVKELLPEDARLHFIGHLQRNKVKGVLELGTTLIQSIDSYKLAKRIDSVCNELGIKQDVLIQVKTDEAKPHGVNPAELEEFASEIIKNHPNICIKGLMTISPFTEKPEESKTYFVLMKKLYDELQEKLGLSFDYLSMGMSSDYKIAVEEGSNMVRIGRAIFD